MDYAPEKTGPGTPSVQGYEWRFRGSATASGLGAAWVTGNVTFELVQPAQVLVRGEFGGIAGIEIDGIIGGSYSPSLTIIPSPLFHEETTLQPGEYTLRFYAYWDSNRGNPTDGSIEALIRFEPAACNPADLNRDGIVDHGDIVIFINLFLASCP